MKVFNQQINLKQVLIVIILLLLGNAGKIYLLYSLRTKSDISFYDYFDHISVFLFSAVAVISVLIAWKIINKIDTTNTVLKFVKVYMLSFLIFIIIGVIVDYVLLGIIMNNSDYDFIIRFINTMTVAFILVDIFALTSAFYISGNLKKQH